MARWAQHTHVDLQHSAELYGSDRRKVAQAVECWSGKKAPRQ
eukprot:COSAG02_NODE_49319_length_327_cov_1.201754_1_plen_41_part_10